MRNIIAWLKPRRRAARRAKDVKFATSMDRGQCPDLSPYAGKTKIWKHDPNLLDFRAPLRQVKEQASKGCNTCSVLYHGYLFCGGDEKALVLNLDCDLLLVHGYVHDVDLHSMGDNLFETGCTKITVYQENPSSEMYRAMLPHSSFYICSIKGADHPWSCLRKIRPPPSNLEDRCRLFRKWMKACQRNHPRCGKLIAKHSPKRLLDTGCLKSKDVNLSLIDVGETCPPYITMSHCWAKSGAAKIQTTRGNIDERRTQISWESLPRTIQDAIVVTRLLRYQHLWIDSLCIMQDECEESKEERDTEISRMDDIYAGSAVTIASHFDPDTDKDCGLFLDRETIQKITQTDRKGKPFTTYIKPSFSHGLNRPRTLTGRAWCLQERLLSRRVLHFRPWEVSFECFSSYRCECIPDGHTSRIEYGSIYGSSIEREDDRHIKRAVADRLLIGREMKGKYKEPDTLVREAWEHWHSLVKEYMRAELSVAGDILSALSGIVHRIPPQIFGSYVAGLWSNHLPWDLMWRSYFFLENTSRRPAGYVAPSFSWASISGPMNYEMEDILVPWSRSDPTIRRVSRVLQFETKPLSKNDPMGAIESGFIRLRSRMLKVKFCQSQGTRLGFESPRKLNKWTFDVFAYADTLDDIKRCTGSNVYILEIATTTESEILGLLVTQSKREPGCYERIGFIRSSYSNPRELIPLFDGVEDIDVTLV